MGKRVAFLEASIFDTNDDLLARMTVSAIVVDVAQT